MSNNESREKVKIEIERKEEFVGVSRTDYKSSTTIARSINDIFQNIFSDYNGCYIEPGNQFYGDASVTVVMDFIPGYDNGHNGALKAFELVGAKELGENARKNGPIASATIQHNQISKRNETYEITQDAVDILYELLLPNIKNNTKDNPRAFANKKLYQEGVDVSTGGYGYPTKEVIHEYMRCLDITQIMSLILPKSDEEGNRYIYEVTTARPLASVVGTELSTNYLIGITQYNQKAMSNIINECGYVTGGFASRVIPVVK